ncbi:DUF1905 domain-containing protein [Oscillochloris sp. ZM17-4]|nr:DUF1905 domain-containing protein [Oscillochloris sp. ZM17-4]MBX0327963.1 DUF1905 domain-containing protein [Oscillochloris sp. ZM17-4]
MQFHAIIELHGKTATGMQVPAEVVTALGAGKRPAVRVTINGYTYRSTVAAYREAFMLPLSAEHRAAAGGQIASDARLAGAGHLRRAQG